ncbi:MAG: nitroreductase family protein [Gemmataceae bacterium]|nr:nitroreductase family protein [Gemmataceae bacterium]
MAVWTHPRARPPRARPAHDGPRPATRGLQCSYRFLLPEAGHLLQNLCLLSASLGLATVPLGGYLESEVVRACSLSPTDVVLYLGVCGAPTAGPPH